MYGGVVPGTNRIGIVDSSPVAPVATGLDEGGKNRVIEITWKLIVLLSAEFLSFADVVIPLISKDDGSMEISNFWEKHSLIALAACAPYILVTAPIAMGYNWYIRKWPWNLLVWIIIVLSLAFVCHIASVTTDPQGVFVGTCSISLLLLFLGATRSFRNRKKINPYLICFLWQLIIFFPMYFTHTLTMWTSICSGIASIVTSWFLQSELRLMENGQVVIVGHDQEKDDDPFIVAIWINCATWRFMVQGIIICQKIFFQFLSIIVVSVLVVGWKWIISKFAKKTPKIWLTPETLQRIIKITHKPEIST